MNSYKRNSRNRDPAADKAYRIELNRAMKAMQRLRAQICDAKKRRDWRLANYLTNVFYTGDSARLVNPFHGVRRKHRRKPRRTKK